MIENKIMSLDEIKKEISCGCDIIGYVEAGKNFVHNRILSDKDIRSISIVDNNIAIINFRTKFNIDYLRYPNGTTVRVKISKQKQRTLTFKMWLCVQDKDKLSELSEIMCKWILVAKLLGKINNINVACEIRRFVNSSDLFNIEYDKNLKHHVFEYHRIKDRTDMKTIIKDVKHALGLRNGDMKCIYKIWEEYNADRLLVGDMKIYTDAYAMFYRTHTWITRPSLYTQDIISVSRVYDDFITYLHDVYKHYIHPKESKWIKHGRGLKNTIAYKIKFQEFLERIVVDYIKSNTLAGEVEHQPIDVLLDYDNLLAEHLDKVKTDGARIVIENDVVKVADYKSPISFKKFSSTILQDIARKYCIRYTSR